jgi:hypothetical protein
VDDEFMFLDGNPNPVFQNIARDMLLLETLMEVLVVICSFFISYLLVTSATGHLCAYAIAVKAFILG